MSPRLRADIGIQCRRCRAGTAQEKACTDDIQAASLMELMSMASGFCPTMRSGDEEIGIAHVPPHDVSKAATGDALRMAALGLAMPSRRCLQVSCGDGSCKSGQLEEVAD